MRGLLHSHEGRTDPLKMILHTLPTAEGPERTASTWNKWPA
jgi:hypothetical protein